MNDSKPNAPWDHAESGPRAIFCRKCGSKLLPDSSQCTVCGTVVEYVTKTDTQKVPPKGKQRKKMMLILLLLLSLSVALVTMIVLAVPFLMQTKPVPQDINSINGCPEFYNIEFGMTIHQASRQIELEHKTVEGMVNSSLLELNEYTQNGHITFEEGQVFELYGIKTTDFYVSFDGNRVNGVLLIFEKQHVPFQELEQLYTEIYGPGTTDSAGYVAWVGPKTTIEVYDYETLSGEQDQTVVVRYKITENSQFTALSFDGPEIDPCDFLGANYVFDKKPDDYLRGLKKDEDYAYQKFSPEGFTGFEKYTLYPQFEYMGIAKGNTAIEFDIADDETTIGAVTYLLLLDKNKAADKMDYIQQALTGKYGVCESCTFTSTQYDDHIFADIRVDELIQMIDMHELGLYHIQWVRNGLRITLGLTISMDGAYYEGYVTFAK